MLLLSIETSCDETAAAVVRDGRVILSSVISSQIAIHAAYGGVVPEIASRKHLESIAPVVSQALRDAGVGMDDLEGVAVTRGPGLSGALLVGFSAAKAIAVARKIPFVGVHHIEGHLFAPFLERAVEFPFLALVVSGGHTHLYHVEGFGHYTTLGRTIDDAAGEAFDKCAKIMGMPYPGGALIDRMAQSGNPAAIRLPRPLLRDGTLNFSFSGLKTAVLQQNMKNPVSIPGQEADDLCASFQEAVCHVLAAKTEAAIRQTGAARLVVAGGVACNSGLRLRMGALCEQLGVALSIPPPLTVRRQCRHAGGSRRFLSFAWLCFSPVAGCHRDLEYGQHKGFNAMSAARRPLKSLGQNFLVDGNVIDRIIQAADIRPDQPVLEIGPGRGALTTHLAERAGRLVLIEFDHALAAWHQKQYLGNQSVTVVDGDVLKVDLDALLSESPLKWNVVANLPYNISTEVLFRLYGVHHRLARMTLMLQKEVGDRLAAPPDCSAYGVTTVLLGLWFDISRAFVVHPGSFHPSPKVDSAVLNFIPRSEARADVGDEDVFRSVVKSAFSMRRKTLVNCLKSAEFAKQIDCGALLEACAIDGRRRGETLSLEEFAALSRRVTESIRAASVM